jgi:hypothetical protein
MASDNETVLQYWDRLEEGGMQDPAVTKCRMHIEQARAAVKRARESLDGVEDARTRAELEFELVNIGCDDDENENESEDGTIDKW